MDPDKNSTPLMLSEALLLLQSSKPPITTTYTKFYSEILDYCKKFSKLTNSSSIENLKQGLRTLGLSEFEISQVGTVMPRSVQELRGCFKELGERLGYEKCVEIINLINSE